MAAGDLSTARATVRFLFERQQLADGRFPRNSLVNGKQAPDTGGDQLDETAYPILMAYQAGLQDDGEPVGRPRPEGRRLRGGARSLVRLGAVGGAERLLAVDHRRRDRGAGRGRPDRRRQRRPRASAGLPGHGRPLPAQHQGLDGHHDRALRHRPLLHPARQERRPQRGGHLQPRQRRPRRRPAGGHRRRVPRADPARHPPRRRRRRAAVAARRGRHHPPRHRQRARLLPLRHRRPRAPRTGTATATSRTPPNCSPNGKPWPTGNSGSGHVWPVLNGERAEQHLQTGEAATAARLLLGMQRFASGIGLVPEQAWENPDLPASPFGTDPETASIGFENGGAAGSASPLTWAQAQQVRLTQSLGRSRPVEQPRIVRKRYQPTPPPAAPVDVTAPADGATVTTATVDVTGTTTPGATVDVASTATDTGGATTVVTVQADASGAFSATVPGAVRHLGDHGRGDDRRRRDRVRPAHRRLRLHHGYDGPRRDRPVRGRHRAGHLRLPDVGQLPRRRLRHRAVPGDRLRRQRPAAPAHPGPVPHVRLAPGCAAGRRLRAHPGATTTSTAPPFASRNYAIADDSAWSSRIEVQGFASPVFVDAAGQSLGTVSVQASQASRYITMIVPLAALGTPGPGWKFTVVLHGQDGFSPDQARGFQPTPQPFQFGLCAPGRRQPDLRHRPRHRAEGDGRDHPGRRRPVRRARPHAGAGPDRGRRRPLSRRVTSGQYGQFTGGSSSMRTVSQPPVATVWITSSGSRVPTKTSVSLPPWQ